MSTTSHYIYIIPCRSHQIPHSTYNGDEMRVLRVHHTCITCLPPTHSHTQHIITIPHIDMCRHTLRFSFRHVFACFRVRGGGTCLLVHGMVRRNREPNFAQIGSKSFSNPKFNSTPPRDFTAPRHVREPPYTRFDPRETPLGL